MALFRATLAVALVAVGIGSATAQSIEPLRDAGNRPSMHLRLDNDTFAGSDRGYTNGIKIGFTSPTVASFQDPRLGPRLRSLNRRLAWLQPRGFDDYNVTLSLGQGMFTPEDWRLGEPDRLDRPYAGVLAGGVTYNGRDADKMRSTTLDIGLVGPSAVAEQAQDFVHDLIGGNEFRGWEHQLGDEPAFRVLHQRLRKWDLTDAARMSDAIVHYGGSIGNLTTFANAGVELRFGRALPDNFGSAPALPVAENTAPTRMSYYSRGPSMHGFVALDARYVLRDITLDGNTWRDSASVAREELVADLGIGFAMYWQGWKITFARYFRTKEFESQTADTKLGSITIRRDLADR
jgi:lipid A 3-O-deacylase